MLIAPNLRHTSTPMLVGALMAACGGQTHLDDGATYQSGGTASVVGARTGAAGGTNQTDTNASATTRATTESAGAPNSFTSGGTNPTSPESGGSTVISTTGAPNTPLVDVQTIANEVTQASDLAQSAGGTLLCARMIPTVRVATEDEIGSAVLEYVSNTLGVPPADFSTMRQTCETDSTATCANMFQNDLAHYGGRMSDTTHEVAQTIESQSTNVHIRILTATQNGVTLPAVVVLAGIQDGWLVSIVVVPYQTQC